MVRSSPLPCGGLSLCGSFSARLAGVRIVFIGFFGWCAARSLHAHLDSRGGCAGCAGVSVRGSRGRTGLPSVAFWWFWGAARRAAVGFRRVAGDPWGPVYVGEQTVRFPLLGPRGSEVGGEQCKQST